MDLRTNSKLELILPWAFYLPFGAIYLLTLLIGAIYYLYYGLKLICKRGDPTPKEIAGVDHHSINPITLEQLTELN
jgi:hypothetical protein